MQKEEKENLIKLVELTREVIEKGLHIGENSQGLQLALGFLERLKKDVESGVLEVKRDGKKESKKKGSK